MSKKNKKIVEPIVPIAITSTLKLDFGAGPNPREGFEGVDQFQFSDKVTHVMDIKVTPWPWANNSVAEAHASHFVEHLTGMERVKFVNELYRVLVPGGQCQIIVPHWASCRAYGDPTHQWPPVSEFWFYYLSKEWRKTNCPHDDIEFNPDGFNCDFSATWGYSLNPAIHNRNQEFQQFAIANYKESCSDIISTLVKI